MDVNNKAMDVLHTYLAEPDAVMEIEPFRTWLQKDFSHLDAAAWSELIACASYLFRIRQ